MPQPILIKRLESLMNSMCLDALDIARQYCDSEQGKASCTHYHGIRFLLHRLGARTTLSCQHEVFYADVKKLVENSFRNQKPLRVLISGTADFVIPSLVSFALRDGGVDAKMVIVDRCETPLQLCRFAADQFAFDWHYQRSDIVDLNFDKPFDLIVTDRLLGHLPPIIVPLIMNKWASLLSSKGRLLTVVSLRQGGKPSTKEGDSLLSKLNGIEDKGILDDRYSLLEIEERVTSYVNTRSRYPVRDTKSLGKMFEPSSLEIESIKTVNANYRQIENKDLRTLVKIIAHRD